MAILDLDRESTSAANEEGQRNGSTGRRISFIDVFSNIFNYMPATVRMPIGNFLTSIYIKDNYSNLNNIYRVYKIVARIVLLENREINNAAIARGS